MIMMCYVGMYIYMIKDVMNIRRKEIIRYYYDLENQLRSYYFSPDPIKQKEIEEYLSIKEEKTQQALNRTASLLVKTAPILAFLGMIFLLPSASQATYTKVKEVKKFIPLSEESIKSLTSVKSSSPQGSLSKVISLTKQPVKPLDLIVDTIPLVDFFQVQELINSKIGLNPLSQVPLVQKVLDPSQRSAIKIETVLLPAAKLVVQNSKVVQSSKIKLLKNLAIAGGLQVLPKALNIVSDNLKTGIEKLTTWGKIKLFYYKNKQRIQIISGILGLTTLLYFLYLYNPHKEELIKITSRTLKNLWEFLIKLSGPSKPNLPEDRANEHAIEEIQEIPQYDVMPRDKLDIEILYDNDFSKLEKCLPRIYNVIQTLFKRLDRNSALHPQLNEEEILNLTFKVFITKLNKFIKECGPSIGMHEVEDFNVTTISRELKRLKKLFPEIGWLNQRK